MSLVDADSLLPRVLEPEAMDTADEARDYDSMDHSQVNRQFVSDFLTAARESLRVAAAAASAPDPQVLDLGTGTAQIPIELCRQDPRAQVLAIDLAAAMLRMAQANVQRAGLGERITLEQVDAKRLPFADGRFTAVMSNSIVHHIPAPLDALAEAVRVVAQGGLIFVRDLARPRDARQVRHLVDCYAADCNDHQRALFEASLHAALSVTEMRSLVEQLGFSATTVAPTSDRHWTWRAVKARDAQP